MLEIWKAIHYHAVGQLGQILGQVGPDPTRCVADETGAERAVRPPARGRTAISPPPIILLTIAPDSPPIFDVPTVGGLQARRVSSSLVLPTRATAALDWGAIEKPRGGCRDGHSSSQGRQTFQKTSTTRRPRVGGD